jgi:hypothetical protein
MKKPGPAQQESIIRHVFTLHFVGGSQETAIGVNLNKPHFYIANSGNQGCNSGFMWWGHNNAEKYISFFRGKISFNIADRLLLPSM